ncbi:MAG TPA: serine/threonine-protein kinase, partial [Burkholderiaceae bacterium]|nr:serine/threonine-protein kinase [Burkholderiaceae bacterium]
HSKGVVHRDVKPANIFMIGRTQPKVLDFGIARIAHQHEGQQAGDIAAGSPYYMAPEQARHEPVDRRADVFSLGVVLYELLTDLKPFRGNTLAEITAAVLKDDPPLANAIDPAVPEALAQIAAKALAKNPEHRYRSARALARELRHWLDENTVLSEGDVQLGPPRRSGPLWIALGTAAVLALGVIAWAVLGSHRAPALPAASAAVAAPAPVAVASAVVPAAPSASAPAAIVTPGSTMTAAAAAPAASIPAIAPAPASLSAATETPAEPDVAPKEAPRERRARERAARAAAATTAAAAVPTGALRIAISPWGEVEVDGRRVGTSPPMTELSLPAGRHHVVVRNTDLPPYSAIVNVSAEQPVSLKHKF